MGEVVELAAYRPSEEDKALDRQIIESLLGKKCEEGANSACGLMSMRLYQLGVSSTDVNALMDMDVMRFLAKGIMERSKGLQTDNTLLLDTLHLHFQFQVEASSLAIKE